MRELSAISDSTLTVVEHDRHADLPSGTVLGGEFRIVSKIGAGGMGCVYLARDNGPLGAQCAVKVLASGDPSRRKRFLAEAQIMASLRHPNIVRVFRYGEDEATRTVFYAMDDHLLTAKEIDLLCSEVFGYELPGLLSHATKPENPAELAPLTLAKLVEGGRALPEAAVAKIALDVVSAIEAAHSFSPPVVHRDIKPSNIIIARDGRAMLADFGIAKFLSLGNGASDAYGLTTPNAAPGTWMFAAPEQLDGGTITPAADFYSFGLVLFRSLTGGMPNRSASLPSDIAPHVSKKWKRLFAGMLDQNPHTRLADSAEITAILKEIILEADRRRTVSKILFRTARTIASLVAIAALVTAAWGLMRHEPSKEQAGTTSDMPDAEFNSKWARQYASSLRNVLAKAIRSPVPDADGRIVVRKGQTLLSGDIPESATEVLLDGGHLCFSPSYETVAGIAARCEDIGAGTLAGADIPNAPLLEDKITFSKNITVSAEGGHIDTIDGDVSALVEGEVKCAEGVEKTSLDVFGLSSLTFLMEKLDKRINVKGTGRLAVTAMVNGKPAIKIVRFFDYEDPLNPE